MISKLKGEVTVFDYRSIIVNANGVGYKVFVNQDLHKKSGSNKMMEIWVHLAVRETSMELYGFEDREALDFFEMLISVSGIGPKTALNILNIAPMQTIKNAVSSGDITHLTKVSGIGKKNAEKIVLELKDKLGLGDTEQKDFQGDIDAIEALKSLGYSPSDAREALKKIPEGTEGTAKKIKEALRVLARR